MVDSRLLAQRKFGYMSPADFQAAQVAAKRKAEEAAAARPAKRQKIRRYMAEDFHTAFATPREIAEWFTRFPAVRLLVARLLVSSPAYHRSCSSRSAISTSSRIIVPLRLSPIRSVPVLTPLRRRNPEPLRPAHPARREHNVVGHPGDPRRSDQADSPPSYRDEPASHLLLAVRGPRPARQEHHGGLGYRDVQGALPECSFCPAGGSPGRNRRSSSRDALSARTKRRAQRVSTTRRRQTRRLRPWRKTTTKSISFATVRRLWRRKRAATPDLFLDSLASLRRPSISCSRTVARPASTER